MCPPKKNTQLPIEIYSDDLPDVVPVNPVVLNIGMMDVDLLDNGTRHPNLAQMKMAGYCKSRGHKIKLIY